MGRETRLVPFGRGVLACEDTGGCDRPVLLVHGFTGSRDDWSEVVEPLAARTGRVVSCDLRGHGESTNVGTKAAYAFDELVADMMLVLDGLDIGRCDAVGHSLGGLILAEVCRRAPERFGSLVLMSTPLRPIVTNMAGLLAGQSAVARLGAMRIAVNAGIMNRLALVGGMRMLTPFFVRSARVGPPSMRASRTAMGPDVFDERVRTKVRAIDPRAFVAIGDYLTRFASIAPTMRAITCPTMVMVGEEDDAFVPRAAEVVAELRAGGNAAARLEVVPGAAHSPQIENTAAWLDLVAEHATAARRRDEPIAGSAPR
jgi:pimeloyl-ACP methyl ester carboxylesterase